MPFLQTDRAKTTDVAFAWQAWVDRQDRFNRQRRAPAGLASFIGNGTGELCGATRTNAHDLVFVERKLLHGPADNFHLTAEIGAGITNHHV